ncbi:MAG: prephenate dehydrogenase, partial [Synergistales bacterium]|nr:prephenate dehydrogenase [Synergistales bacterium]
MSLFVDVALPGLWWNDLTYCTERPIDPGCRVVVPLRKTERVGFVVSMADHPPQGEARKIEAVLDSAPPLGLELWELAKWASTSYLCSLGRVLKLMSPAALMKGEPVSAFIQVAPKATRGKLAFCYVPRDTVRWGQYVELLEKTEGGALVLFPEQMQAHLFWKALPVGLKE